VSDPARIPGLTEARDHPQFAQHRAFLELVAAGIGAPHAVDVGPDLDLGRPGAGPEQRT
jgi:hypothetical protein